MKPRSDAKWISSALAIFVALPFIYNSCQQFQSVGSPNSQMMTASFCKVMLENGGFKEIRASQMKSVFSNRKVILSKGDVSGVARAQTSIPVKKGSKLSVVLDNNCLRGSSSPRSDFLKGILAGAAPFSGLDRQAFSYSIAEDTTQAALEGLAGQEPCLVGMSWENVYHVQQASSPQVTFNDPLNAQQTHLGAISAFLGDSLFYASPYGIPISGGLPVKIALLDTGIDYTHPDLAGNIWQNQYGFGINITTLGGTVSYNPMDISTIGHGTHVAGIAAAVSNNGIGITGTIPYGAQIMAIKIFSADAAADEGVSTTTTDFLNGMSFARLNGADVINLSLAASGTDYDAVAQQGLQDALSHGITVVVAMGNGNPSGQLIDGTIVHIVPAVYSVLSGVIGVASFDAAQGNLSAFSNYSTTYAEIAAPGEEDVGSGIYSTLPVSMSSYGQLSGTSQATPMVSAAAALTIGWIRAAYGVAPSPAEVERLITSSSDSSAQLSNYVRNGNRLNLYNLANTILAEYPRTAGSGSTTLPNPAYCGN